MGTSVLKPRPSDPVQSLENLKPSPAKAGLPSDQTGLHPGEVVLNAVVAFYGSIKSAAFALGEVDPSLMCREIRALDLRRLQKHAPTAVFDAMADAQKIAFGQMETLLVRAMRLCYGVRRALDELEQIIEGVA